MGPPQRRTPGGLQPSCTRTPAPQRQGRSGDELRQARLRRLSERMGAIRTAVAAGASAPALPAASSVHRVQATFPGDGWAHQPRPRTRADTSALAHLGRASGSGPRSVRLPFALTHPVGALSLVMSAGVLAWVAVDGVRRKALTAT